MKPSVPGPKAAEMTAAQGKMPMRSADGMRSVGEMMSAPEMTRDVRRREAASVAKMCPATSEMPSAAKMRPAASEMPSAAKMRSAASEMPSAAKMHPATAEMPSATKMRSATAELASAAKV
jgi:hypothetical protein